MWDPGMVGHVAYTGDRTTSVPSSCVPMPWTGAAAPVICLSVLPSDPSVSNSRGEKHPIQWSHSAKTFTKMWLLAGCPGPTSPDSGREYGITTCTGEMPQVLTAVGYQAKRPQIPSYIDNDVAVSRSPRAVLARGSKPPCAAGSRRSCMTCACQWWPPQLMISDIATTGAGKRVHGARPGKAADVPGGTGSHRREDVGGDVCRGRPKAIRRGRSSQRHSRLAVSWLIRALPFTNSAR